MSTVINVPIYCGLHGCIKPYDVIGVDCKGYKFHACNEHVTAVKAQHARIYEDVARVQAENYANWRLYVGKFSR